MSKHTVKVFVLIDANGDHVAAATRENLMERHEEEIGDNAALIGSRVVELTLDVEMPAPIAASVTVPITSGSLQVAAV